MEYAQNYVPLGNLALSALVAAVPAVLLLVLLGVFRVKAHVAAAVALVLTLAISILVYGMPVQLSGMAALYGAAYGMFPIGWIILNAIFVYDITVETGKFEVVKDTIAGLADDRRLQLLLIAFAFGAFIEGAAGFGTPVAISAAMLIGLGFKALPAAGLALIGNTAPVAYGALGTPLIALESVTGLPLDQLSAMVGRQLPFFSLIVPFWLVWAMAGRKAMVEVWPACLTAGASFAVMQFAVSNFHGPWLVDIIGALVSMGALYLLFRRWQPATTWRFPGEDDAPVRRPAPAGGSSDTGATEAVGTPAPSYSRRERWLAWAPWILLSVFVFIWGIPQVEEALNIDGVTSFEVPVPLLDGTVTQQPPVVSEPEAEEAVFEFTWLSFTGTALLLAGIASGLLLRLSPGRLLGIYWQTLKRCKFSLLTIAFMLALGYCSRYTGLDATMGLALASTGVLFPFFSPLLGWLGVALTGSDTSSNVLFGNLQTITAQTVGVSGVLLAAANSSGGVMGKMIDAQSIVVAGVATGQVGQEGPILRYVFKHSVILAMMVGVVITMQAYLFPWVIP